MPICAVRSSWFPLRDAEGRIAAEGALPYPPGVLCVVPGEVWGGSGAALFRLRWKTGINLLPGFAPELQGVYVEEDADGRKQRLCACLSVIQTYPCRSMPRMRNLSVVKETTLIMDSL